MIRITNLITGTQILKTELETRQIFDRDFNFNKNKQIKFYGFILEKI